MIDAVALQMVLGVGIGDDAFTLMVKNGRNGFLVRPTASPIQFARRIAVLLQDQRKRRKFAAMSTQIARAFSEEEQARKLARLYERLLRRRRRRTGR